MKNLLFCKCGERWQEAAPLVLRLAVGVVFAAHGWQKLGAGVGTFAGFLGMLGVPAPVFFAWVVTLVELAGGATLIVGLLSHWAAKLLAVDMLVAIFLVHVPKGLFTANGGFEFPLVLFAAVVSLAITGAGKWSLDRALFKQGERRR